MLVEKEVRAAEKLRYQFFVVNLRLQLMVISHRHAMENLVGRPAHYTCLKSRNETRVFSNQVIHDDGWGADIRGNHICLFNLWVVHIRARIRLHTNLLKIFCLKLI
jgi:hypothetical protein